MPDSRTSVPLWCIGKPKPRISKQCSLWATNSLRLHKQVAGRSRIYSSAWLPKVQSQLRVNGGGGRRRHPQDGDISAVDQRRNRAGKENGSIRRGQVEAIRQALKRKSRRNRC